MGTKRVTIMTKVMTKAEGTATIDTATIRSIRAAAAVATTDIAVRKVTKGEHPVPAIVVVVADLGHTFVGRKIDRTETMAASTTSNHSGATGERQAAVSVVTVVVGMDTSWGAWTVTPTAVVEMDTNQSRVAAATVSILAESLRELKLEKRTTLKQYCDLLSSSTGLT